MTFAARVLTETWVIDVTLLAMVFAKKSALEIEVATMERTPPTAQGEDAHGWVVFFNQVLLSFFIKLSISPCT